MTDGRDPDRPRRPGPGSGEDEAAPATPRREEGREEDREEGREDETAGDASGGDRPGTDETEAPPEPASESPSEKTGSDRATTDEPTAPERPAPRRRRGGGAGVLALVLVLALIAALAWPVWLVLGEQRDPLALVPSERLDALEQRIDRLQDGVRDNRRELEASSRRDAGLESRIDELRGAFSRLSSDLNAESPLDERQWRIAEAAYLLRVADLRARMENDRDGARAMLEAADELIAELDDLGLYPVREAIADALAELRARPVVDRVGLYLELESLAERVAAVPLDLPRFRSEEATADDEQDWLATLENRLGGLFDFRVHRPEPVTPLMAPDRAFHLRHNLLLLLEQAQLALLRGDAAVWEDTLGEAQRWIREHFDPSDPEIEALARALERLGGERVEASAPDISTPHDELMRLRGRAEATP